MQAHTEVTQSCTDQLCVVFLIAQFEDRRFLGFLISFAHVAECDNYATSFRNLRNGPCFRLHLRHTGGCVHGDDLFDLALEVLTLDQIGNLVIIVVAFFLVAALLLLHVLVALCETT
jgi:hypothetical protein